MDKRIPSGGDEGRIRDALRAQNKILALLIERAFPAGGGPVDPKATEATEAWARAADDISAIRVRGDKAREAKGEPDIVQVTTKRFDLKQKG